MSHYRSPIDYATDNIDAARRGLARLYTALRGISLHTNNIAFSFDFEQKFKNAMNDDFNTPEAIAVLFEIAHEINRHRETEPEKAAVLAAHLKKLGNILGILFSDPEAFLQNPSGKAIDVAPEEIEQLIAAREEARKSKQWAESDRIRDVLLAKGISLEDTVTGTTWYVIQ
jgi:cysteinyl-tRNA synthetase